MAHRHESSAAPEPPRHRFGLTRLLFFGIGLWFAFEALGSVLAYARHLVALVVLVLLVVIGWHFARSRKT